MSSIQGEEVEFCYAYVSRSYLCYGKKIIKVGYTVCSFKIKTDGDCLILILNLSIRVLVSRALDGYQLVNYHAYVF